ncbi:metallophosphoesterase [Butyricimonas sp. Marseille-P3923]|uniref:metallophosphoesterase n=1 Tax=Butyricimonas sp. Marseille-P3923 TaxID=1987504 RepID=UPI000C08A8EF|nr:metallophosphoesterase [Butyricimonas sp. Marseille-P3923]
MKWFRGYIFFLFFLLCSGLCIAQDKEKQQDGLSVDGPYVMYDSTGGVRVVRVDERGVLRDTVYADLPAGFTLEVVSERGGHRFRVPLHLIERPAWKTGQKEKTLIISDPHGDLESFISVLRNNGVIGKDYNWKFGKNQVIIIGDVFDRGKDVLPIFWLIYKLEQEAREAGGVMTFMLGNHEEMVLRNNLKYTRGKYKNLADSLGMKYADLWHGNSELGRWLRSRNLMQIVGNNLFVHAGLSKEFTGMGNSVTEVNEEMGRSVFFDKEKRKVLSALSDSIYCDRGPFWFRGMVKDDEKYRPSTSADVDRILSRYGVGRVFVGHTIFDDVTSFFDGRVVAVNVNNQKNREAGKGRGILMQGDKLYVVYDKGKPREFK